MKLQLSNVTKSYGAFDVLAGADFQIKGSEKIGLVGRNGCGKTTLLKIIAGQESMDGGQRILPKSVKVGTLSQITFEDLNQTPRESLLEVFAPVRKLEQQLSEQAQKLGEDASALQLEKYDRLQEAYRAAGGYEYETELKTVFFNFGFSEADLDRPLQEFSSGQRTRMGLVKLLLSHPDILLLDEPTNHLDIQSIEWLEGYVRRYPGAVVVVSHDRMFLDRVCDVTSEIEFGKITTYAGSYSSFLKQKEDWLKKNHAAWQRQQDEIRRLESLIEKFRYKKNKAAFAQSKIRQLDRMEKIEDSRSDTSLIKARFTSGRPGGKRVLEADCLQAGYDHPLAELSITVMRGQRLGIIGPNGIGKSTLIKTLAGMLPALGGTMKWGHQIDVGIFLQDAAQEVASGTVLDALWDENPEMTQTEVRNILASFLFTQDEVFKDVADLSGGERVRLALARLMSDHDNVLLLDEPTNHLDIPAREALEEALQNYDGTILFISHDRMFLSKMATRIFEIGENGSRLFDGSYLEWQQGSQAQPAVQEKRPDSPRKEQARQARQDHRQLKNRIRTLENLLSAAEEDLEALRELRYEPEFYQDYRKMEELDGQIDDKHNEISALMQEWEEKMALLEQAEECDG